MYLPGRYFFTRQLPCTTAVLGLEQVAQELSTLLEPFFDCAARQALAFGDLDVGNGFAQLHAPDLAHHVQGDHVEFLLKVSKGQ